jgi:hypothetical protein
MNGINMSIRKSQAVPIGASQGLERGREDPTVPVHLDSAVKPKDANEHFRRHARTLFSVPLTLRHLSRSGVQTTRGISLDIGEGGLGVLVQGDVHIGDTVAIDLRLWEQALTAVAIVRHTTNIRSGLEFVGLTSEERLQIANGIPEC